MLRFRQFGLGSDRGNLRQPTGIAATATGYDSSVPRSVPHPNAAPWPEGREPTPFQQDVVDAVSALKPGDLVTFGELAIELGRPGGGQAVANVLRSVPDLPWWRIVPSEGRLYRDLVDVQRPLLESEGHRVDDHRRVHPAD